jgi:hypothetical protein
MTSQAREGGVRRHADTKPVPSEGPVGIRVFVVPVAQDVDGGTKPRHDGGPTALAVQAAA